MRLEIVVFFVIGCTKCWEVGSLTLDGVITGNRLAGVPLGRGQGAGELDVEGVCQEPGPACLDCNSAVTCVPLPEGFLRMPLQQCGEGQTCNARLGGCSDDHVPECQEVTRNYQYSCEQVGIFPDAHDCRKFHLCSPPEGMPSGRPAEHRAAFCPRHYGYNPQTAQCSIKLTKGQCSKKPVPDCQFVGQFEALELSQNYFYICLEKKETLYPQIFLCPHGWYFSNGFCSPELPRPAQKEDKTEKEVSVETTTETNEDTTAKKAELPKTTVKPTTSRIDSFFSTEKLTTFAPDAFLADKFDLTNYESIDDESLNNNNNNNYDFASSNEFW